MRTMVIFTAAALVGCGGAKATVEAAKRAKAEQPSIEVCLDRLDDVQAIQGQVDDFLFRSPLSANAPWAAKTKAIPPQEAMSITQEVRTRRPYDKPGRQVPPIKVFRLYNEKVLGEAAGFTGNYMNFVSALDSLAPEGSKIKNKYEEVKANHNSIAEIEGKIEGLEAEADLESTPDRRKGMISSQIESLEKQLEELKLRNESAETALFDEVEALEARGMLGSDKQPLAQTLFYIAQHISKMENEALITTRLVGIQLVRAIPDLPAQLQQIGKRLIADVATELGAQAGAVQNANIQVSMEGGMLRVSVSGLQQLDPRVVQQNLTARLVSIKDQVMNAPTTAAIGASIAQFDHKFFTGLAEALAANSGNTFSGELSFSIPSADGAASGGFGGGGTSAPSQPQPGWGEQPGMPAQPGAPSQPQPGWGEQPGMPAQPGAPSQPQPDTSGQPGGGQPGMPAQPGAPSQPPAAEAAPQPQPSICPAALCGGVIDASGMGRIEIGMPGQTAAREIGQRIAPKVDATHPYPTANVAGILVSFCNDKVCRLEATVNPPATAKGLGVGSPLDRVARKYGNSMCTPIGAQRFALEFENLEGVYWIGDKFDCEGIEDIEYMSRQYVGDVESVVVGMPK
ncbi:MAG: hypothetical protein R6V85_01220 [Polyangia bacterium]